MKRELALEPLILSSSSSFFLFVASSLQKKQFHEINPAVKVFASINKSTNGRFLLGIVAQCLALILKISSKIFFFFSNYFEREIDKIISYFPIWNLRENFLLFVFASTYITKSHDKKKNYFHNFLYLQYKYLRMSYGNETRKIANISASVGINSRFGKRTKLRYFKMAKPRCTRFDVVCYCLQCQIVRHVGFLQRFSTSIQTDTHVTQLKSLPNFFFLLM